MVFPWFHDDNEFCLQNVDREGVTLICLETQKRQNSKENKKQKHDLWDITFSFVWLLTVLTFISVEVSQVTLDFTYNRNFIGIKKGGGRKRLHKDVD